MAGVSIKNLVKRFGRVVAVDRVSLEVRDGEFVVLLGPSGCGKTTTLRCIAGLETPDEGEIYIGGRLVNDLPPKDRDVAMVFQNYALYPHMSVYDNLAFPLKMRKYPKDEIRRRVYRVAEMLKIKDLLDRKPRQLSGGQQQRVALGRALVREPKVFLMDEPLSNLDAKLRVYMRAELKRLQNELKITTIYVTHDQVEAMTMADRIAIMNEGRVQQYASPDTVYKSPANVFVAGFIGNPPMNFIDATLAERDGSYVLDAGDFVYEIDKELGELIKREASSNEVILGVRPEDMRISRERVDKGVEAEVYVVEPLGSEMIADLRIGGYVIKVRTQELDFQPKIGDKVWVAWDDKKIHVFDKKTERALV